MVNEDIMSKYPQAHAIFMPYLISDHSSALLIIPNGMRSKKRSFKFANYITNKEEFCPIVKDKWKANMGGMFKALKEELKCVQTAIDANPYDKSLREKGSVILESYLEAVKDEENLLFQK
ncbi:hypothetical protein Tco_1174015 [Tanacetum coccineum]